jgi:MerR family transcriptional regulator, light-induced transcriptional regulator
MDRYTLADLEKLTGIQAGTIRIWERRYHIIKPHRTDTNRRWYDDDDLKRIINIAILNRSGLKISKIAALTSPDIAGKVALLTRESTDTETQIDAMIVAMTGFNENAMNDILMRSVISTEFEATFENIVFPFLKRVGIMWHTGSADIGAEHFVSNVFRKRLICAIDSLPPGDKPDRKKVILYLPGEELHELGLLFYTFIVRKSGHETLYLGQATPFDALADVVERWHPDMLVTGTLTGLPVDKPEEYLKKISSAFRNQKILVSGALAYAAGKVALNNVFAAASVSDLKKHI